jgi:hypothetical protein
MEFPMTAIPETRRTFSLTKDVLPYLGWTGLLIVGVIFISLAINASFGATWLLNHYDEQHVQCPYLVYVPDVLDAKFPSVNLQGGYVQCVQSKEEANVFLQYRTEEQRLNARLFTVTNSQKTVPVETRSLSFIDKEWVLN